MKRVLILTYYWPPSGGAGVQRWLKFVKYLRNFNWEPIVYTAENGEMPVIDESLLADVPEGIKVIKTKIWEPYSFYKMIVGQKKDEKINAAFLNESKKKKNLQNLAVWIRGNFFIPDARKYWIKPSSRYLAAFLSKNPVDAIISSGPPHSMHLIALNLKKKFPDMPWIADFRDPWTQIDFYEDLKLSRIADAKHRRLEKLVLNQADVVVSIGQTMSEELYKLTENEKTQDKFKVITNGFDDSDLIEEAVSKDTKFSIAHIGTLVKTRNPVVLWQVLKELVSNRKFAEQLEIKLVGKVDISVLESIEEHGLKPFVRFIEYLPHKEVIQEQKRSRVNLLLINQTANAKSILTGKFFEYLAADTPILAIGPTDGDAAKILNETNAGLISEFNDKESLKHNILALFDGKSINSNKEKIQHYSRKNLTKKLVEILNEQVSKKVK